jgi:hypothetical protein
MNSNRMKIIKASLVGLGLLGTTVALSACGGGYSRTTYGASYSTYDRDYYGTPRDRDADGIPNRFDFDRDGDGVSNRFDWAPNNPYRR